MRENKKTVITILLLSLAALILLILLLTDNPGERIQSRDYLDAFDTVSTLYDYSGDRDFESIADKVGEMMLEYHRLYDIYNSTPEKANIRTVNTAGGEAVVVDKRIIELIEWGIEIYYLTDGEVNIAMGSVTSLWKSSLKSGKIPTEKELSEAALHTDITKIEIDREKMTIRLSDPKMSLDVGAVAKGYTEEKIAEWLVSEGKSGYALDMGGNLRAIGEKPSGKGFTTGIRNPDTSVGGFIDTFTIKNESSATSGGYERYYEIGGVRYHHIIDKDTLASSDLYLSATVVTKSAALADALSTAVFCMSEEQIGKLLSKAEEPIKIIIADKNGDIPRFDN